MDSPGPKEGWYKFLKIPGLHNKLFSLLLKKCWFTKAKAY